MKIKDIITNFLLTYGWLIIFLLIIALISFVGVGIAQIISYISEHGIREIALCLWNGGC